MPSFAPGVAAAISFGTSDVLVKVVLMSGCSLITMLCFRGLIALVFMGTWLCFKPFAKVDSRVRWISMCTGLVFACLIFLLYQAIDASDVPTAIVSYFIYPLLTGFGASLLGLEKIHPRGFLCAIVALFGLAIMVGAHPAGLAYVGVALAMAAAACRTIILLMTRRFLVGADAWATTWYAGIATMLTFLVALPATSDWRPPVIGVGWLALIGVSLATTAGIMLLFVSTTRIGAFRSALIMQLEPFTAIVLSALLIGEIVTPIQALGSAVMLGALTAFQLWR